MTESNSTNGTLAGNRPAMERFIARLRDSGNVRMAAQAAGVPRRTVYNWRDRWKTFAAEWDEALEDACDILEAEAWKRAVQENSDRLLMFLLKAYRPDRFKDRAKVEHSGDGPAGEIVVSFAKSNIDIERL